MGNAASAPTLTGKLKTETEAPINALNSLATYQRRPTLSRFVSTVELLTRAFRGAKHTLEASRFILLVTEDLEFLRDARERFQSEKIECLYRSWRLGELGEHELRAKISQHRPERAIYFDTYLINGQRSSQLEFASRVTGE